MSAETTNDVSLIQDEDILRKMWQETEDFGRKKEIRSHMYKLREQRLREFYNNGEVTSEIRTTSTGKTCDTPTHADSLADHSFLSLKTKEIRDSESPTRDVAYKITEKRNDQGWQIQSTNETSADGKAQTVSQTATKSGTQQIGGGKIDYAAKNQQTASVYQDGDDKNFTKAVGAQSNTVIQQEAVGGDEHSNFKSSSTKTSSSSRVVTEHRSTSGDDYTLVPAIEHSSNVVSRKVYTDDEPVDIKKHPNFVEGKTTVIRETKTLPDGSTVTTTRYETKGATASKTESSSKYSTQTASSTQKSSINKTSKIQNSSTSDQGNVTDNGKAIEFVSNIPEPKNTVQYVSGDRRILREKSDCKDTQSKLFSTQQQHSQVIKQSFNIKDDKHITESTVKNNRDAVSRQSDININIIKDFRDDKTVYQEHRINETIKKQAHDAKHEDLSSKDVSSHTVNITDDKITKYQQEIPTYSGDNVYSTTTATKTITTNRLEPVETQTSTTLIQQSNINNAKHIVSDQFINIERQQELETRDIKPADYCLPENPQPVEPSKIITTFEKPQQQQQPEKYQQPERRQPIKPGKSELDSSGKPTEGQYDTTYRADYTQKKISVEVSATHDAFARSLRSITPERITNKCSSPSRSSLRNSNNSLRNSTSPEKVKPHGISPDRHSRSSSPRKSIDRFSSNETITYSNRASPEKRIPNKSPSPQRTLNATTKINSTSTKSNTGEIYCTDTVTGKKKVNGNRTTEIDSNTLTKRKNKPRSRSVSPISTVASEIEFIRNVHDIVTDLDDETTTNSVTKKDTINIYETSKHELRPTSLEITKKTRKVTERSPTSPLIDAGSPTKKSPIKELSRSSSLRSPAKDRPSTPRYLPEDRPLKRTDTYEERCRQILGLTETTEKRKSSLERNSLKRSSLKDTTRSSVTEAQRPTISPDKKSLSQNSPERKSPNKEEVPSQTRRSPTKEFSKISEFPSQIKKWPIKEPLGSYPERKSPTKQSPKIFEFPSQIRKSPTKEPLESYPEQKNSIRETSKISEFPSHIRKSSEKERLGPYPEKKSPTKNTPKISEFPSQIRKSPEKEQLEPYPEKKLPRKNAPSVSEFPSQVRRSPEREPLEPYPEKKSPTKDAPKISEFPSQVRKSPEKEKLEPYSEKKVPKKDAPGVSEFPSQVRRPPAREPLEPYSEKKSPTKDAPKVSEFPSQIRKSPEKGQLESYPEKKSPKKDVPGISEFLSQIKKSPEREPIKPCPEKKFQAKDAPKISEFPSQIRRSPDREQLAPYPEKKSLKNDGPHVSEFQIRKSPERESIGPYPEKKPPIKDVPCISEFPSQIKRSPETKPLEPHPEKKSTKDVLKTVKLKKPKFKNPSDQPLSSSSSDEEQEIEEVFTETITTEVENRIPIKEPEITKKFVNQLCREEEIQRTNTLNDTEDLLKEEIENELRQETVTKTIEPNNKPHKHPTQNDTTEFIDTEINISSIRSTTESPEMKKTPKKPRTDSTTVGKTSIKTATVTKEYTKTPTKKPTKEEKTKFFGQTEFTDQYSRIKPSKPTFKTSKQLSKDKITLMDIDNLTVSDKDTSVHVRTHRIDDTINKKISAKILVNGDVTKKPKPKEHPKSPTVIGKVTTTRTTVTTPVTKKPSQPKVDTPQKPTQLKYVTTVKKTINVPEAPLKVKPEIYTAVTKTTKLSDTTTRSTKTDQTISRTTKTGRTKTSPVDDPVTPKKHLVTTTIIVTPRDKQSPIISKTTQITAKTPTGKITEKRQLKSPKKMPNDLTPDTDDESVVDSLDDSTTDVLKDKIVTEKSIQVTHKKGTEIGDNKQITIKSSKAELNKYQPDKSRKKPEQRCITTKTVIINQKNSDDRKVIVDLQRSKSSREPTPDRLCPVPLSSDEESSSIPRYPDLVTEPDDGIHCKKPKRLADIPIMETERISEFTRLTDVTDTQKVEETDNTSLSFIKKEQRDTIEKYQPKPTPPRIFEPNKEIPINLQSDECRLTVSDKVNKFISTAESLITPQQIPDRPKSPKCQNYDDILSGKVSEKISQFTTTTKAVSQPTKPSHGPAPKVPRPDLSDIDESIKDDECLLSVSDKVSKFITTAENLTKDEKKQTVSLAGIDVKTREDLITSLDRRSPDRKTPERTVADRKSPDRKTPERTVPGRKSPERKSPSRNGPTKYVTTETEEQIITRKSYLSPERSPSPGEKTPDRRPSNQYSSVKTESQEIKFPRRESSPKFGDSTPKSGRRSSQDEPKSVLSPTGRLRSTESIQKAKALFENINKEQEILKQRDILSRPSVFEKRTNKSNVKTETKRQLNYSDEEETTETSLVSKKTFIDETEKLRSTRLVMDKSRARTKSPEQTTGFSHYRLPLDRSKKHDHDRPRSPKIPDSTTHRPRQPSGDRDIPHYMLPLDKRIKSDHEHPPETISYRQRERDTDSSPDRDETPHYMLPLERNLKPDYERDKLSENTPESIIYRPREPSQDRDDIPHYMLPLDRDVKPEHERTRSPERRSETPTQRPRDSSLDNEDKPHYMLPLDRSLRPHSPHKESHSYPTNSAPVDTTDLKSNKFGVTLRRTNADKGTFIAIDTVTTSTERRKSIVSEKRITEEEIDDIFDLEILEELLVKVVGYELRRKIRTQIRLVKKLLLEGTLETYISQRKLVKKDSKQEQTKTKPIRISKKTESHTQYIRKTSPEKIIQDDKSYQRTDRVESRHSAERTSEYKSSYSYNERRTSSDYTTTKREQNSASKPVRGVSPAKEKPNRASPEKEKQQRTSPERKFTTKTESKESFTKLRKIVPTPKVAEDDKPEWTKQRNLRKTSEETSTATRKFTSKTITSTKKENVRSSPVREIKATDLITSSYGVGPTDENGSPLFGLKALRAQNKNVTTKGTMITSEYHAETGKEPVGQISVTKYSSDPKDFVTDETTVDNQGVTSVTTTQKFGYKDTPSLKSLTTKQKKITSEDESSTSLKSTKTTRKNSVKSLSQKFIENAVETLKSERQTSYPKAGLILRTSSFKETKNGVDDARETSPAERECESVTVQTSTSNSATVSGDTFLTNKSRVTGVRDVISRMKTEEYREGDTEEDAQARDLLNKFIGSQVILSGMESQTTSSSTTETFGSSPTSTVKRTTKITTTLTEGGKPVTKTLVYQRPITQEELDNIWEEQTLRLLLEQSTDYEERRIIRARLRQVMAEQEAKTITTEKTVTEGPVITKTVTRVTTQQQMPKKPLSPFAKFQQLDKQNSTKTPPRTSN